MLIAVKIRTRVRVVRNLGDTEKQLAAYPDRIYTVRGYTKPHGYARIVDEHGVPWLVHPEALEPVPDAE